MIIILRKLRQERMLDDLHREGTMVRVLLQTLVDKVVVVLGPVGRTVQRRWWIPNNLEHDPRWMHLVKGWFAIAQLDRRNSQCPHVRSVVVDFVV